jgi:hypothetical protein
MIFSSLLLLSQLVVNTPTAVSGITNRADHATVAVNNNLDIAIAYHERVSNQTHLKQVKVAYYRWDSNNLNWNYASTSVVGSTNHRPLNFSSDPKCERPDIVAVGDYFFVTWTRRYEQELRHPATLECSFLKYENSAVTIINGNNSPGLGYQIDADGLNGNDFHVKECAGVVDAFVIDDTTSSSTHTVGVVYPHQVNFESNTRSFDLRIASVSINTLNDTIVSTLPTDLITSIRFEGDTHGSVGLILPDAVRGKSPGEFWLSYESQLRETDVDIETLQGKIRLGYVKKNLVGGGWSPVATHTYGTNNLAILRRPMLANHSNNPANVSIAFSSGPDGKDVDYQQWSIVNDNLVGVTPANGHQFNNSSLNEKRPIPFHAFGYRRCYFSRDGEILYYDLSTDAETVVHSSADAERPAVAIGRQGINYYIVSTWEQGSPTRIWINIEN